MTLLAALLCVLLPACGKVGDPMPPFIRVPEPIEDLAVQQSGYNLVLSWTNPRRYIDGSAATNLARLHIESDSGSIATIQVNGAGERQSYAVPAGQGPYRERRFSIVAETDQEKRSQASAVVSITPVEVPGPVTALTATADQRRIFLRWDKPEQHPELANAYVVTRMDAPEHAETVMDSFYEDSEYEEGRTYTYHVTAVRQNAGTVIPGDGVAAFTVAAEDKTPPAPPTGLEITETGSGAYITWNPNSETDLAGYWLLRSERADAGFEPVTPQPIMTNGYVDSSYRPGLYYEVAAVDESGNRSAPTVPLRLR